MKTLRAINANKYNHCPDNGKCRKKGPGWLWGSAVQKGHKWGSGEALRLLLWVSPHWPMADSPSLQKAPREEPNHRARGILGHSPYVATLTGTCRITCAPHSPTNTHKGAQVYIHMHMCVQGPTHGGPRGLAGAGQDWCGSQWGTQHWAGCERGCLDGCWARVTTGAGGSLGGETWDGSCVGLGGA